MRLTRNKLLAIVNLCAARAHMTKGDRAKLLAALSDPSVTSVLVGDYGNGYCGCPLSVADIEPWTVPSGDDRSDQRANFAGFFDDYRDFAGQRDTQGLLELEVVG